MFCAYHGAFYYGDIPIYYGVMPDLSQPGCNNGCGDKPTVLQNLQAVSSHELVEAATDPNPGSGWIASNGYENSDLCNAYSGPVVLGDGVTYNAQAQWSNVANTCTYQ